MTDERYTLEEFGLNFIVNDNGRNLTAKQTVDRLNELNNENEELIQELKIYRKVANCRNCHYHNYDWFDDGDEFEVCDKGNDMSDRICEEWEEL